MSFGTDELPPDIAAMIDSAETDGQEQQAAEAATAQTDGGNASEQQGRQQNAEPQGEDATQHESAAAQQPDEQDKPVSRQALRAARRSERLALQRLEAAQRELEALRQQAPQAQAATDELSDDEIAELAQDIPAIGKLAATVKALKGQLQTATAAAKQQPAADPEFVPPYLPPEVQEDVDEVPELLAWQTNPDQAMFTAAVQMDNYLRAQPAWANKPQAERFAEVVRRVKQDAGIADQQRPAEPTKQRQQIDPKEAIKAAPRRAPASLSDLTGGLPQPEPNELQAFLKARTPEELMDMLDRLS